ncbi:hypothetical protein HNY73_004641 [Argiope bruennichi]|uniref:Uncharacterized protein n=1 Tax=Argiope bruennichi TaxID=94029 RepID=A0A8T0FSF8_ARGBR|nr:hypothetical protein HNY73_004641 [Argiope bruennichi]
MVWCISLLLHRFRDIAYVYPKEGRFGSCYRYPYSPPPPPIPYDGATEKWDLSPCACISVENKTDVPELRMSTDLVAQVLSSCHRYTKLLTMQLRQRAFFRPIKIPRAALYRLEGNDRRDFESQTDGQVQIAPMTGPLQNADVSRRRKGMNALHVI